MERGHTVRDDRDRIELKELRDFVTVMADLVQGIVDGRLFRIRVLEFEKDERKAIDENEKVRPAVILPVNWKLVDDEENVAGRIVPIDRIDVPMLLASVGVFDGKLESTCEKLVKRHVPPNSVHPFGTADPGDGVVNGSRRNVRVSAGEVIFEDVP